MSMYDADNQWIEWGREYMRQMEYYMAQLDSINLAMLDKINHKLELIKLYEEEIGPDPNAAEAKQLKQLRERVYGGLTNLKIPAARKRKKIQDKISECHNKLALFLCENYHVILLPKFDVSTMVPKKKKLTDKKRCVAKKVVRDMLTWSHFKFRELLQQKAELYPWVTVITVNEAYTSKTCGACGHLNEKLGARKEFVCPTCDHEADCDMHAAKNILLRYLTEKGIFDASHFQ